MITALALASATASGVQPWTEAVVSVTDISATTRLFREAGGWTVRQKGEVAKAERDYWKLPDAARGTFELLCAPQSETGCIRFVCWSGVDRARSNFGIPFNYTNIDWRNAAALAPVEGETGRVEVMQIDGFEGSDLSEFAQPQNFGIVSVRFPVTGLAAYRTKLEAKGVAIAYEGTRVAIAGIGTADLFAVREPDGGISEFYEGVK